MKKRLIILAMCLFLLSGCREKVNDIPVIEKDIISLDQGDELIPDATTDIKDEPNTEEVIQEPDASIGEGVVYDVDTATLIQELDVYGSLYYGRNNSIFLVKAGVILPIEEGIASEPVVSPDGTQVAYIDSYDFETIGNLKVYNLKTDTSRIYTEYVSGESDMTIKQLDWINNQNLAIIVGYAYGTLSLGGNLYVYDIENEAMTLWIEAETDTQIVKVKPTELGFQLEVLHWLDDNYMTYETKEVFYAYDQLKPTEQ